MVKSIIINTRVVLLLVLIIIIIIQALDFLRLFQLFHIDLLSINLAAKFFHLPTPYLRYFFPHIIINILPLLEMQSKSRNLFDFLVNKSKYLKVVQK